MASRRARAPAADPPPEAAAGDARPTSPACDPPGPPPAAQLRTSAVCDVCGEPLAAQAWIVQAGACRRHYDCWTDRSEPKDWLTTIPASDVVDLGTDLKDARRQLRQARQELRELQQQLATTHQDIERERAVIQGLSTERDIARVECNAARAELRAETQKLMSSTAAEQTLRSELNKLRAHAGDAMRVMAGEALDAMDGAEIDALRAKLEAALERVDAWRLAEEAIEQEHPELCCTISLKLMHDPVCSMDGRTYERINIERHFATLVRDGKAIQTPQRNLLESTRLIPNHLVKTLVKQFVQKKAEELAASGTGKRARRLGDEDRGGGRAENP